MILPPTDHSYAIAIAALSRGELVGLPTETVYGLAANALDPNAVEKIFSAKGRPATNPLIVHVATVEQAMKLLAEDLSDPTRQAFVRAASFWPGPLTLIARKSEIVPSIVTAGGETVAIRVPNHPVALELLRRLPFPLAAPSANRSNYVSPTTAQHVADGLGDRVSVILDGGPCDVGLESTILKLSDASERPRILRSGAITGAHLSERLRCPIDSFVPEIGDPSSPQIAPGQFAKHYAPRTTCRVVDPSAVSPHASFTGARILRITIFPPASQLDGYSDVWTLSMEGDVNAAAARLYETLRRADDGSYEFIEIDRCVSTGIGIAMNDRIERACVTSRH